MSRERILIKVVISFEKPVHLGKVRIMVSGRLLYRKRWQRIRTEAGIKQAVKWEEFAPIY
jgi:hypothetical protein